jgi:hypothetical protein
MQKRWTLLFQRFNVMHELDGPVIRIPTKYSFHSGPGSVAGIATGYELDGPGIESRWRQIFPHLSRPALRPTRLLYNGYPVFPGGKERPGRDADPSLSSSAVGYERVELYLYFLCGPNGLYRASVPAQGCNLLLYSCHNSIAALLSSHVHVNLSMFI